MDHVAADRDQIGRGRHPDRTARRVGPGRREESRPRGLHVHLAPRLEGVTAFRLETLPHPSLPHGGCGRNPVDAGFLLGTFRIELASGGAPGGFRPLAFARASCDDMVPAQHGGIEVVLDQADWTAWTTGPASRSRGPHRALFVLDRPCSDAGEVTLRVTLIFPNADQTRLPGLGINADQTRLPALGRLRLSATSTPGPLLDLEETVYPKLTGWARLAAAFALRGEWSSARDALGKAAAEPSGGTGCDRFLLAWVNHRLGCDGEARGELARAIAWMEQHDFGDELTSLCLIVMPELLGTRGAEAVFDRVAKRRPWDDRLHELRVRRLASLGRWDQAARVSGDFLEIHPLGRIARAAVLVLAGNRGGYEQHLRQVLDRGGGSDDPLMLMLALRPCVLAQGALADLEYPVQVAERVLAGSVPDAANLRGCALYVLGAACFRAGQFDRAVRYCRQSVEECPGWTATMLNWPVLALAYKRLGNVQESRKWLSQAQDLVDRNGRGRLNHNSLLIDPFETVVSWLELMVWLREAEASILYDPIFPADPFAR